MKMVTMEKGERTLGEAFLTCPHCGHTSEDVATTLEYVGGLGYVPRTHCTDEVACWARWDRTNGFEDTPAIREMQAREMVRV